MDGNDFTQSFLASERHRQFEREVQKDELAKLVPSTNHGRLRALAQRIQILARSRARRARRLLPARDA